MKYVPPKKILERYADVMVNFALGDGKGIRKGDVVRVTGSECVKPLYIEILHAITKAGGHVISNYAPDDDHEYNASRDFYMNARDHQIRFFAKKYFRGLVDEVDHFLFILGEADIKSLKGIDPKKILASGEAMKPYREWRTEKENKGKLSWTLALYGTPAMAKEAGLSEKEYWKQIIDACFLNASNPVKKWKNVDMQMRSLKNKLNKFSIEKLHVKGPDADLWITLGKKRLWAGGGGKNIPSFEIFTSPDWRGTNGWIRFNNPVYSYGNLISGIELRFKNGVVVSAKAKKNEKLLKQMIRTPGGNKVGEFSMTDRRFSNITKFMAETLYDENIGGPNGNMHIALGKSFHECYGGNITQQTKKDWDRLGFNDSSVHQDMVSTVPRTITAILKSGKETIIYKDGMFQF